MRKLILAVAFLAAAPVQAWSQNGWDDPFAAHRVMDNLYFVGTGGLGTFLITTPEGHILINTDFERTIPMIERSMEGLGFDLSDIKIILGSHAPAQGYRDGGLSSQLRADGASAGRPSPPIPRPVGYPARAASPARRAPRGR